MNEIKVENLLIPPFDKTINLCFQRELNYIRGENGTGKTILLDYISGVRNEKKGIIIGNKSVMYINQNIFFADRLNTLDFIKFITYLDCNRNNADRIIDTLETYVSENISDKKRLLKTRWGMLSGGERKFLYAVVLLNLEREWYILDEPFAFIDEKKKKWIWNKIDELLQNGKGIILTSHEDEIQIINHSAKVFDM